MYAATNKQNKVACLGVVNRDSRGKFVAVAQKQEGFFGDVLAAEQKQFSWVLKLQKLLDAGL